MKRTLIQLEVSVEFPKVARRFWKRKENQQQALEVIGKELGVKDLDDWYKISTKQLKEKNSSFINRYYNGSLFAALKELFPHHKWDPLRFSQVPKSYWKDLNHHREC
jgi:hypothetical protein